MKSSITVLLVPLSLHVASDAQAEADGRHYRSDLDNTKFLGSILRLLERIFDIDIGTETFDSRISIMTLRLKPKSYNFWY